MLPFLGKEYPPERRPSPRAGSLRAGLPNYDQTDDQIDEAVTVATPAPGDRGAGPTGGASAPMPAR